MALEVRGIEQDEMAAWVASLQVPFHVQRPASMKRRPIGSSRANWSSARWPASMTGES
jgi:hypothetical protein